MAKKKFKLMASARTLMSYQYEYLNDYMVAFSTVSIFQKCRFKFELVQLKTLLFYALL
jgi:hypothetical protein